MRRIVAAALVCSGCAQLASLQEYVGAGGDAGEGGALADAAARRDAPPVGTSPECKGSFACDDFDVRNDFTRWTEKVEDQGVLTFGPGAPPLFVSGDANTGLSLSVAVTSPAGGGRARVRKTTSLPAWSTIRCDFDVQVARLEPKSSIRVLDLDLGTANVFLEIDRYAERTLNVAFGGAPSAASFPPDDRWCHVGLTLTATLAQVDTCAGAAIANGSTPTAGGETHVRLGVQSFQQGQWELAIDNLLCSAF